MPGAGWYQRAVASRTLDRRFIGADCSQASFFLELCQLPLSQAQARERDLAVVLSELRLVGERQASANSKASVAAADERSAHCMPSGRPTWLASLQPRRRMLSYALMCYREAMSTSTAHTIATAAGCVLPRQRRGSAPLPLSAPPTVPPRMVARLYSSIPLARLSISAASPCRQGPTTTPSKCSRSPVMSSAAAAEPAGNGYRGHFVEGTEVCRGACGSMLEAVPSPHASGVPSHRSQVRERTNIQWQAWDPWRMRCLPSPPPPPPPLPPPTTKQSRRPRARCATALTALRPRAAAPAAAQAARSVGRWPHPAALDMQASR